ncbi:MAG: YfbM family protein [Pseudomonadota bacterium]
MGMVWVARLADDREVARIRENPDGAYDFIQPEAGWETAPIIDLDKEWHALHFLLAQSAGSTEDPLSLILGNYESIGPDNGYGPAFLITSEKLRAFSEAAKKLNERDLAERYNTKAMMSQYVYLADMYDEEGEEGIGFLKAKLDELRKFAERASNNGLSALAVIT